VPGPQWHPARVVGPGRGQGSRAPSSGVRYRPARLARRDRHGQGPAPPDPGCSGRLPRADCRETAGPLLRSDRRGRRSGRARGSNVRRLGRTAHARPRDGRRRWPGGVQLEDENYLGFPTGISGGDLTQRATVQAQKFGASLSSPCAAVSLREEAGHLVLRLSDGTDVPGRAVIVATGARYRRLDAVGLEKFESRGVYYAATELEARSCAGSPVVVAGGGNSAGQAALFLVNSASAVTIVIRGPDLAASMSRYLVDRIEADKRIAVRRNTRIVALEGNQTLTGVRVSGPGGEETLASTALFSFIGADPASEWLSGFVALDDSG